MPDITAPVDLRSDTVTRPTPAMREAIAGAVVGDDALCEDPTVRLLERRIASLLGKPRALFFPSGIMANTAAILAQTRPGAELLVEATAHIFNWEDGAAAAWGGLQVRPVPTPDGILTAELVEASIRRGNPYQASTCLIALENTHLASGGRVFPIDTMRGIADVAARHKLPVHLDGTRLWNAATASGIAEAEYADTATTVSVSLSKALGCPVGAVLAGPAHLIDDAWRIRRRLGGAMRQSGILAAAGLHALEHHRGRIAEDHANARLLARVVAAAPGLSVVNPETNVVMIDLAESLPSATELSRRLAARGVLLSVFSDRRLRAVTHLDVDETSIRRAGEVIAAEVEGVA